jgi:hypothetical protein
MCSELDVLLDKLRLDSEQENTWPRKFGYQQLYASSAFVSKR